MRRSGIRHLIASREAAGARRAGLHRARLRRGLAGGGTRLRHPGSGCRWRHRCDGSGGPTRLSWSRSPRCRVPSQSATGCGSTPSASPSYPFLGLSRLPSSLVLLFPMVRFSFCPRGVRRIAGDTGIASQEDEGSMGI